MPRCFFAVRFRFEGTAGSEVAPLTTGKTRSLPGVAMRMLSRQAATSAIVLLALLASFRPVLAQNSAWLNSCNEHGEFDPTTKRCTCYEGWGAPTDVSKFKSPTCEKRVCPAGTSWGGIPTGTNVGHALAECSDQGLCDRGSGECVCFDGFDGRACDRLACPNRCSGHGDCMSIRHLARVEPAEGAVYPLTYDSSAAYEGAASTTTWDQEKSFGCLCHSAWPVGLGAGQSQLGEWYGDNCRFRRCPSGDDPMTDVDETDCAGKVDNGRSNAPTFSVSVTQSVASSDVLTTVTHADVSVNARTLLPGDKVTISGHTGDSANLAMNQEFTVSSVNSATETVLLSPTYGSMTPGSYNSGSITMAVGKSAYGNKCHIECSNRGTCDRNIGVCECFKGFSGNACEHQEVLAGSS